MLNRFSAVGRLTKDPVLQKTSNGISTIKFSVAVERDRKDSTGSYPTDFILCQAWRSSAEFLSRYGRKGMKISVDGRIETGSYDSNGRKVFTWIVNCEQINLLDPYGNSVQKQPDQTSAGMEYDSYSNYINDSGIEVNPDDLPF